MVGSHNVIDDYQHMLHVSMENTATVMATILSRLSQPTNGDAGATGVTGVTGAAGERGTPFSSSSSPSSASAAPAAPLLTLDAAELGDILMGNGDGGDDALVVVYNPLAFNRTDMIVVPVPVCNVAVYDVDTGREVRRRGEEEEKKRRRRDTVTP